MFNQSLVKRYFLYVVMVAVGVLIGAQLVGAEAATVPAPAEGALAQATGLQASALEPAAAKWYTCTIDNVATYVNRVHVRCSVADSGILYFAVPVSDYKHAARVLSHLLTAQAMGSAVTVLYDTADTSGAAWGCGASDCRPILAVATP